MATSIADHPPDENTPTPEEQNQRLEDALAAFDADMAAIRAAEADPERFARFWAELRADVDRLTGGGKGGA